MSEATDILAGEALSESTAKRLIGAVELLLQRLDERQQTPGLFTTAQAAEYLGIKESTVNNWRCLGTFKVPYAKVGGLIRYRREDLDKWVAENLVQSGIAPIATRKGGGRAH